ncbi:MAG: serine/threonine protein kinase [Clostridiales bacterium]|nr:serine/threonine protein kinase [Clostridiales bacterium]
MNETLSNDKIILSLPLNSAYISAARLTASSIANRLGFSTAEIEDVKAAVSEGCTFIIKEFEEYKEELFKISFFTGNKSLIINIEMDKPIEKLDEENICILMIKALMDEANFTTKGNKDLTIVMKKIRRELDLF